MGNFYTNYTLKATSQKAVAAALSGRSAIVTSAQDGCVVVFDEQSEDQDAAVITELALATLAGVALPSTGRSQPR